MRAGSGSNPNGDEGQPSASPSLNREVAVNSNILVVEDNPADVFQVRETIEAAGIKAPVHVVNHGETATRFIDNPDRTASRFLSICAGAAAPGTHFEYCNRLAHGDDKWANAYFRNPSEYDEFMKLANLIREWFPIPPLTNDEVLTLYTASLYLYFNQRRNPPENVLNCPKVTD
jgi:CheY-like chemotaxis protein